MSSDASAGNGHALALAREAHARIQVDPRQGRALAERALAAASAERDVEAEVAARHALGWSQTVLGDVAGGMATLRAGIRLAERHGDRRGAALLRRHLAVWLASSGRLRAARREIAGALAVLDGRDLAQAQVQRLDIHRRTLTVDATVHRQVCADAARALRRFRREGDALWEARLLFNRGLLHLDRGELDRAEADVCRAHMLYTRAGARAAGANAAAVVAGIAATRGEILSCLKTLDTVKETELPGQLGYNLAECRMLALSQARLLPEARAAAEAYIDLLTHTGGREFVASVLLDLADIALMSGDPTSARVQAASAARSFAKRGKPVHAALARAALARARLLEGEAGPSTLRSCLAAASVLELASWRVDALRVRALAARLAVATGSRSIARAQLELARPLRTRGTVADRVELCYVGALLQHAEGKDTAAERTLERGLQLLDEYRAALGAVELRATASGIGVDIARTGLGIALASRQPAKVFAWSERLRASALRQPLVRPPADVKLRRLQTELRRAVADKATTRQARLEAEIRSRARLVEADGSAPAPLLDAREAADLLGRRALLEYVELDGALHALTLAKGRLTLHELAAEGVASELEWLRFALGQLTRGGSAAQRAAARGSAEAAAAALDAALLAPLGEALCDAPLVLVPTGALHALPWTVLPSLRGRPLVVAPSLAIWARAAQLPRSRRRKHALVAGPRLRHAVAEVKQLALLRDRADVLHGEDATARATLAAVDGAALAHLACHGHFRADSPLFSSLELADGPLNVYDLQTLHHPPEMVVLSACDLALSGLHAGDEVLGLAAVLLGMGTRTIVASVVPVPDATARRLMVALHRGLLRGLAPAAALARAQARAPAAGFLCLGSG